MSPAPTSPPGISTNPRARSADALWIVFCIWTVVTAAVWFTGIGDYEAGQFIRYLSGSHETAVGEKTPFQHVLETALAWVDPVWLILATLVAYTSTAREHGLPTARRWTGSIFATVFLLALLNNLTRFPFGHLVWTDRLGPRLAGVPIGLPLLWCAYILGLQQFIRILFARASHVQISILTACAAIAFALQLEPEAQKARVFWLWEGRGPTLWYYLAWGVLAGGLAYSFRSVTKAGPKRPEDRALLVLFALIGLTLVSYAGRRWSSG